MDRIDVTAMVGAVERRVESTEREGRPAKAVVATRTYPTEAPDLWDALTTPERLARWFLPVSGDLSVGGRFQFEGNAGGEVLACDPPTSFEVTWGPEDDVSWVTVTLTAGPGDGEATLELRHTAHPGAFWDQFGPGAVGVGWDGALVGLALHVGTGEPVDRQAFLEWDTSDEGKAFHTASSDAWGDAAIAGGDDAGTARRRAATTAAFYRGELEGPAPEG